MKYRRHTRRREHAKGGEESNLRRVCDDAIVHDTRAIRRSAVGRRRPSPIHRAAELRGRGGADGLRGAVLRPGAGSLRVGGQRRAGAGESAGAESVCVCAGESAAVCTTEHAPIIPLLVVGGIVLLKAIDYGWNAYDAYQATSHGGQRWKRTWEASSIGVKFLKVT